MGVGVDKTKGLLTMGDVAPEVLSDDDVPGGTVAFVELFLDLGGDVFLDAVFLEGCGCDVDALLLHLLRHVNVFDDGFGAADAAVLPGGRTGVGGGGCGCGVSHDCEGEKEVEGN